MKVYVIFDTAYESRQEAERVESEWSHKETVKERYMYACEDDKETFNTEYGKQVLVYGEYIELDTKLIDCILFLQRNDSNGSYIDMIEEYQNGEIEVSTIKEVCINVLSDWKNEGTAPDDVEQLKELQYWIDSLKTI